MERILLGAGLGFIGYIIISQYYIFHFRRLWVLGKSKHKQMQYDELLKQYQLIFESAGEGICLVDTNLNLLLSNAAFHRMTGYSKDELYRQSLHDLLHHHQQPETACDDNAEKCPFLYALHSGTVGHTRDEKLYRKDGTSFLVEYSITPIVDNGMARGAVILLQDVTSRRESEEMLLKSAKLSVVGQLAASVAHEIRNPLTSLIGFVKLLADDHETKRVAVGGGRAGKYFEIMKSELLRIEKIVNEFLILAKPSKVEFKAVDLSECINHVLDLFRTQAAEHHIEIELSVDAAFPVIECDENRLKQVLINLVKNAIEAMPYGGEIEIAIAVITSGQMNGDTEELLISVKDNGQGIPEDMIPKLGEPFYSTKESGTGLGLMVSHKIIESHNGTMKIHSKEGVGTTVELRIPRYQHITN